MAVMGFSPPWEIIVFWRFFSSTPVWMGTTTTLQMWQEGKAQKFRFGKIEMGLFHFVAVYLAGRCRDSLVWQTAHLPGRKLLRLESQWTKKCGLLLVMKPGAQVSPRTIQAGFHRAQPPESLSGFQAAAEKLKSPAPCLEASHSAMESRRDWSGRGEELTFFTKTEKFPVESLNFVGTDFSIRKPPSRNAQWAWVMLYGKSVEVLTSCFSCKFKKGGFSSLLKLRTGYSHTQDLIRGRIFILVILCLKEWMLQS